MSRRKIWRLAPALLAGQAGGQDTPTPAADRAALAEMINGLRWTQMLSVAARLGIADRLRQGAKTVRQLAEETRCQEDCLYRVLRTLAGRGIFAEEDGRRFRLTAAAELLRSDVPGSLRVTALVAGEDWYWNAWGALAHTVSTGETGFDHVYGSNTWDWFAQHPEPASLFNAFQSENTLADNAAVIDAYDFSAYRLVADVGGGEGILLSAILRRNPQTRGILFDLPHVVADARKRVPPQLQPRVEFLPGDFFRTVPAAADLYLLKFIIHDWTDEKARAILVTCRRSMDAGATLLLVDHVICGRNQPCEAKPGDVAMMVRTGGRNRTQEEYRALLTESGFELQKVGFTSRGLGLLTAAPRA